MAFRSIARLPDHRPDKAGDPADAGPAEEEIDEEDGQGVAVVAGDGDDGRQKKYSQANKKSHSAERAAEEPPERTQCIMKISSKTALFR